jgi:hypothetical protein
MGFPRSGQWTLLSLIVVVGLASAVAFAGEVKQTSTAEPLPADGEARHATAKCPQGHKLTGGAGQLGDAPAIQDLAGWYPITKREWTASGINYLGDPSEVTAHAICLRDARVKLVTESIELDPAEAVTATCPRGRKASGGGLQIAPESSADVAAAYPSGKRKWTAVADPFAGGGELTAHAVCLKDRKLKRKEVTEEIPPGFGTTTTVTVRCKKRTKATGGGAEIDPVETDYVASYPDGKRAWTVEAQSGSGSEITAHVLCLKKRKK